MPYLIFLALICSNFCDAAKQIISETDDSGFLDTVPG